jgi:hypothetical protein
MLGLVKRWIDNGVKENHYLLVLSVGYFTIVEGMLHGGFKVVKGETF